MIEETIFKSGAYENSTFPMEHLSDTMRVLYLNQVRDFGFQCHFTVEIIFTFFSTAAGTWIWTQ